MQVSAAPALAPAVKPEAGLAVKRERVKHEPPAGSNAASGAGVVEYQDQGTKAAGAACSAPVAAVSGSMLGKVMELLPYGLRMLGYCSWDPAGDRGSTACHMDAHRFYVAPLCEVAPAVMDTVKRRPYVSPARPGFRAEGEEVHVRFQLAGASSDCAGQFRAYGVELAADAAQQPQLAQEHCARESGQAVPPPLQQETSPFDQAAGPLLPSKRKAVDDMCVKSIAKLPARVLLPPGKLPQVLQPQGVNVRSAKAHQKRFSLMAAFRAMHVLRKVIHEWRRLETADQVREAVDVLHDEVRIAKSDNDATRLCDVLLRAAGGLAPPGALLPPGPGAGAGLGGAEAEQPATLQEAQTEGGALSLSGWGVGPQGWEESSSPDMQGQHWRAKQDARLRSIVLSCLSALDSKAASSQMCMLPALEHLKSLKEVAHLHPAARFAGRLQWAKIHTAASEALQAVPQGRQKEYERLQGQWRCSVPGCAMLGWMKRAKDSMGPAGFRCHNHRGFCNVPGCHAAKLGRAKVADQWGPPGPRCDRHSRICSATGCSEWCRWAVRALEDDELGPAGYRCDKHKGAWKSVCEYPGCERPAKARIWWDGSGDLRCSSHDRQRCGEPGCNRQLVRAVREGDPRCHRHGGERCAVDGCWRRPMRQRGAEFICNLHAGVSRPRREREGRAMARLVLQLGE